jgi:hypothetical protein
LAIAASANRIIPKIKPKLWERIAQAMLDALTPADGGAEGELAGAMRLYLAQYLSQATFIDAGTAGPRSALWNPTVYEGQIAIHSIDLQLFINKTFLTNLAVKDVTSMLVAIGASSYRLKEGPLRDQSRWPLPVAEFQPSDYIGTGEENRANV